MIPKQELREILLAIADTQQSVNHMQSQLTALYQRLEGSDPQEVINTSVSPVQVDAVEKAIVNILRTRQQGLRIKEILIEMNDRYPGLIPINIIGEVQFIRRKLKVLVTMGLIRESKRSQTKHATYECRYE